MLGRRPGMLQYIRGKMCATPPSSLHAVHRPSSTLGAASLVREMDQGNWHRFLL